MKLLLFHPGVAKIDCRDCVKRLYDLEKGELVITPRGPMRELTAITEKDGHKAPCRVGNVCAKGSPETAHLHELSRKNRKTLAIYLRKKHGGDVGRIDTLLADNMRLIGSVFEQYEAKLQSDRTTHLIAKMTQALFAGR